MTIEDSKEPSKQPGTWGIPTPERRNQNGGVTSETIAADPQTRSFVNRYRAVWASPLEAYRAHKILNKASYMAGVRFHKAYYGAVLCRKIDMRPTSDEDAAMKPTKHEQLLKQAYTMLPPDTLNVVVDVCGNSHPVYSPRALEKLRKGLGHLAIKWHMVAIETCEHKRKET